MSDDLIELWREKSGSGPETAGRRGWGCADEAKLAAYVDGGLNVATRKRIEAHLADCQRCVDQVSFLVRANDWSEFNEVPPGLKAKARSLVNAEPKSRFAFDWRWAPAALAACLLVTFLALVITRTRQSPATDNANLVAAPQPRETPLTTSSPANPRPHPDVVATSKSPAPVMAVPAPSAPRPSTSMIRSGDDVTKSPKLLSPYEGQILGGDSLEFRWQRVPEALFYEVSVTSASGDVLASKQTGAAMMKLSDDVSLKPATKYFVFVRAYLRNGQTVRSRGVSFSIAR